MKTNRDLSISAVIVFFGLSFLLPALFFKPYNETLIAKIWIGISIAIILAGLLIFKQIKVNRNILTKQFLFHNRSVNLNKVVKFKIKNVDLINFAGNNPISILHWFKNGERYSKFRILILYFEANRKMKIDERFMPTSDFNKLIKIIKKNT